MGMTKTMADIKRAYDILTGGARGEWIAIIRIAEMMDVTKPALCEALRLLAREDRGFTVAPQSNQKVLTPMQREWAMHIGGQDKHIICWDR